MRIFIHLLVVLTTLLLPGCTATPTKIPETAYAAVYLVQGDGQLSKADVQAHPEIIVTSSFSEFKKLAENRTALWIDINAVDVVDRNWLGGKPQKFYPVVLIGLGDALCAFRDVLGGFGIIEGPYADCSSPPPGFSVWMLENENGSQVSAFMRGYEQAPSAKAILEITTPLLGKK